MQDILSAAMEDGLTCATELPYFEGDFWPNVLEESIKELDQEEEERLKAAEKAAAAQSASEEVSAVFNSNLCNPVRTWAGCFIMLFQHFACLDK